MATYHDGVLRWIDCFDVVDGRITTVWRVANTEMLAHACHT
ncbi:hypothetical protein ACIG3E_37050 [Streptomyces sp. NPDC053474]